MALIRVEVRDLHGHPLPEFCDDFLDLHLPVNHAGLAQSFLRMMRGSGRSGAQVHSVHFVRDGVELGSWSLDQEPSNVVPFARKSSAAA